MHGLENGSEGGEKASLDRRLPHLNIHFTVEKQVNEKQNWRMPFAVCRRPSRFWKAIWGVISDPKPYSGLITQ